MWSYDEYLSKKKKEKEEQENKKQTTSNSTWSYDSYLAKKFINELPTRLESLQSESQSIYDTYKSRFFDENEKYKDTYRGDTKEAYNTYSNFKTKFDTESQEILSYLDKYGSHLDAESVKNIKAWLTDSGKSYEGILSTYKSDYDNFSKFKNEDEYKAAVKANEIEIGKQTADLNALEKEIKGLESTKSKYVSIKTERDNLFSTLVSGWTRAGYSREQAEQKALENGQIAQYDKKLSAFGDMSAVESSITEKKQYLNTAKVIQEGIKLADNATKDANFEINAQKGEEMGNNHSYGGWTKGYQYDNYLAYLRNAPGAIEQLEEVTDNGAEVLGQILEYKAAKYMTDDEFKIYNSYIGKGDASGARKYLKSLDNVLNQKMGAAIAEDMKSDAQRILFAAKAGIDQFNSGMSSLFNGKDNYIAPSAIQYASGQIREDLGDSDFKILGSTMGQIGYDALSTTTNMLPSILTSVAVGMVSKTAGAIVGNTLMGASAAGSAYQEALNKGFDKGQARMYSTLVGGSEALLQYALGGIGALGGLSDDALKGVINNIDNAFGRISLKLGTNMASEFTEEYMQEVLTPVFSNFALGTNEDVNLFSEEALYSGMLGALTAASLGSIETASEEIDTAKAGRKIKNSGQTSNLVKFGKSLSADSVAYQLAGKVNEKTGAFTIGRLLHEAGADSLSQTNLNDIVSALEKNNIAPDDAQTIAKWLNKAVEGGYFTKKQQLILENNDIVSKVFNEVIIDKNSTVNQRLQTLNDIKGGKEVYGVDMASLPTEETVKANVKARDEAINYFNYVRRNEMGNHTDFIGQKLNDFNELVKEKDNSSSVEQNAI